MMLERIEVQKSLQFSSVRPKLRFTLRFRLSLIFPVCCAVDSIDKVTASSLHRQICLYGPHAVHAIFLCTLLSASCSAATEYQA